MKLRTEVFLLSTATAMAAIAFMGAMSLASGRKSLMDASLASLTRECGRIAAALDGAWNAMRDLDESFSSGSPLPRGSLASLRSFLRGGGAGILRSGAEVELRLPGGEGLFAAGELLAAAGRRERPEAEAAARLGPSYLLRRIDGRLALFYSAPLRIGGVDVVASLATGMETLDLFTRRQLALLGLSSALAAALLSGGSYLLSRALSRRLEELARGSALLAGGDYGTRADEGGADEAATLAASFNRMSDSIRDKVERLEAEKADRQAFVDNLTHELRTPVTSIVGFAELLQASAYDEASYRDGLARIEAEGRRILDLTESLKRLLVARSAARSMEEVEVAGLLRDAADEARSRDDSAGLTIEVGPAGGSIRCDRSLMALALRNLLENSIHASAPGARILAGCERSEGSVTLYVRDFGRGMSDEEIAAAGTPFRRKPGKGGFGLGLAICKEIARTHGAELLFERPEGGGLLVSIAFANLPAVYEDVASP